MLSVPVPPECVAALKPGLGPFPQDLPLDLLPFLPIVVARRPASDSSSLEVAVFQRATNAAHRVTKV